jgi:hypothetical protein
VFSILICGTDVGLIGQNYIMFMGGGSVENTQKSVAILKMIDEGT